MEKRANSEPKPSMPWRLDWILLATGLISLGMTLIREGRSELLEMLGEGGSRGGLAGVFIGGYLVPTCLLVAFLVRLLIRLLRGRWR